LQACRHSEGDLSRSGRGLPDRRHRRSAALSRHDAGSARLSDDAQPVRRSPRPDAGSASRPADQRWPRASDTGPAPSGRRTLLSRAGFVSVKWRQLGVGTGLPSRRAVLLSVLAASLSVAVCSLVWLAYRAVGEWRHSTVLLVDQRSEEALTLLTVALSRDMKGV